MPFFVLIVAGPAASFKRFVGAFATVSVLERQLAELVFSGGYATMSATRGLPLPDWGAGPGLGAGAA